MKAPDYFILAHWILHNSVVHEMPEPASFFSDSPFSGVLISAFGRDEWKSFLYSVSLFESNEGKTEVAVTVLVSGSFSNGSFQRIQGPQNVQCYPMQRNITATLTNEQVCQQSFPNCGRCGLFH
jgi:hypothetical protein